VPTAIAISSLIAFWKTVLEKRNLQLENKKLQVEVAAVTSRVALPTDEQIEKYAFTAKFSSRAIRIASMILAVALPATLVLQNIQIPSDLGNRPLAQIIEGPSRIPRPIPPELPEVKPVEVVNPNAAPVEVPEEIRPEQVDRNTGVEGGIPAGVVGGAVGGLPEAPPPPPPPPAQPIRVGGHINPPTKTKDVGPQYPPAAQSARVQGVVIIEAVIGPGGKVQDARVLRSIPLLDQAALDAVKQWEFTPTLLNNVPVPVIMTVTVQFTLQ
jgi:protein TonB